MTAVPENPSDQPAAPAAEPGELITFEQYGDRVFRADIKEKVVCLSYNAEVAAKLIDRLQHIVETEPLHHAPDTLREFVSACDPAVPPLHPLLAARLEALVELLHYARGRLRAVDWAGWDPVAPDADDEDTGCLVQLEWEDPRHTPYKFFLERLCTPDQPLGVSHGIAVMIAFEHDPAFADSEIVAWMLPRRQTLERVRGYRDQAALALKHARETIAWIHTNTPHLRLFDTAVVLHGVEDTRPTITPDPALGTGAAARPFRAIG
ncbi:MAG: hypothetical protein JJU00_01275 [Opitutales bacterium]|nr:hypothetical protein [Opitutales bacterium]